MTSRTPAENKAIVLEGFSDFVMLHGRFTGLDQPANWVAVDILRFEDGVMVERRDVIQDARRFRRRVPRGRQLSRNQAVAFG